MDAISLFQQSQLDEAVASMTEALRADPANVDKRYHMAGLLAFRGEFDRALAHLYFIAGERPDLAPAVAMYESSVHGEEERRRMHDGGHVPGTDPENAAAVKRRVHLRRHLAAGDADQAAALMAEIAAEPVPLARLDGGSAMPFADRDDCLGALLEVFVGGRCLWLPTNNLRSLEFTPPRGLLDLLWAQCAIVTRTGVRYAAHVPVLYAGSHARGDAQVRCGHKTEWQDELGVAFRGYGQRVFGAGERELGILELRQVEFPAAAS
jgi:protein involved in temperature-dependent protein secretion